MCANEEDIADVMAEERSRGKRRRPLDSEARRKRQRLRADIIRVIRSGDERAFLTVLREAGIKEGTSEFAKCVKLFREHSGRP